MSHVWRLAVGRYSPLTGEGARLAGGRWNNAGRPVVYTSESLALCLAECLVHVTGELPRGYHAFKIFVPDDAIEELDLSSLRKGWEGDLEYTRQIGDKWLADEHSLAFAVPSVVLPESVNVLINPLHSRASDLRIVEKQPFRFDPRLRPTR